MSGEDKAVAFFGSNEDSLSAFRNLVDYINTFCPDARIIVQDSLLAFRTSSCFAYVSHADDRLFNLSITTRKKLSSQRIDVQPIPGTGSYICNIGINSEADIDPELKNWVRQSYEYSKLSFA